MPRKPAPGGSVFVPRDLFITPQVFGQSADLPDTVSDAHPAQVHAAHLQHVVANAVRVARRQDGETVKALAERLGLVHSSYDRLSRTLRGETMMTFTDLCLWVDEFPRVRQDVVKFMAVSPAGEPTF